MLQRITDEIQQLDFHEIGRRLLGLAEMHRDWRERSCINLIASENVMSPSVKALLGSDMAFCVCDGYVGRKLLPTTEATKYLEEIEAYAISLLLRLFECDFVEHRLLSGTMACMVAQYALTSPGDTIMSQSLKDGGNMANREGGPPGIYHLEVVDLPIDPYELNVDIEAYKEAVYSSKPKLIIPGAMIVLFPYPLKEMYEIALDVGALIAYDGAHIGALIAGGVYQDPLREGSDLLIVNSHKSMGGPPGAYILMNDEEIARRIIESTFLGFVQTPFCNRIAACALSLAEMYAFAEKYARQIVINAKTLAEELDIQGFKVIGKDRGYTEAHQVILNVSDLGGGFKAENILCKSNIIVNKISLPWDTREEIHGGAAKVSGIRIGTSLITRLGMREKEMKQIAEFIRRLLIDEEEPERVGEEVESFMENYQKVNYCFD
jgi:glycine hydroxymethyltransferase